MSTNGSATSATAASATTPPPARTTPTTSEPTANPPPGNASATPGSGAASPATTPATPSATPASPPPPLTALMVAQFLGAFNDNAWKMMVALLAIRAATVGLSTADPAFESTSQAQTTLAYVVFTLPLALFSLPAGMLADLWSKRTLIVWLKALEIGHPYPITIQFGTPLPSDTPATRLRQVVQELGTAAWEHRKPEAAPLHHEAIRSLRTRPWRCAFADANRWMTKAGVLAGAVALARRLRHDWAGQRHVGICLPPTIGGALVNLAATILGKVTVNLNFTAGTSGLESAAQQAGLQTVITSREFLEKAKVALPAGLRPIFLEDVGPTLGTLEKLFCMAIGLFAPLRLLEWLCGADRPVGPDDPATIIFSSGSTGTPKGVVLTHYNILSNVEGVGQALNVGHRDRLLGVLPLFHSFGFMSLWFSLKCGMGIVFHGNPLDAAKIGELVEQHAITFLIATPTFLQLYMRRCAPGQFGSLRIAFTGAEKLTDRLAAAFEEALMEAAGANVQVFAVTGIPDEKKGEALAVLTTLPLERIPEILDKLAAKGLPNLFIPKKDRFVQVPAIPLLGTGKVDLRSVRQTALANLVPQT